MKKFSELCDLSVSVVNRNFDITPTAARRTRREPAHGGIMEFENQRPAQSMVRLFMAYIPSMVIFAAARLELADHIGDAGARAEDLAQKIKVDAAALYRVMRVLAGLGVLRQDNDDRFYVTPFGETLRKDSPESVRDFAVYSHEFVYDAFRSITECVRTGKPARQPGRGNHLSRGNEQSGPYRDRGHPRCLQIFTTANGCGRGRRQWRILISAFGVL
jgi:hypothetical protein